MGSLLHPVGSQPVWVYWVRRGAIVLAVLLVVAALAFVFRPQPEPPIAAAPPPNPVTPVATPAPATTGSATATVSPTPTGPPACDASNTKLSVAGYQKVAQNGKQSFKVAITNTRSATCRLSLKPSNFSLAVESGSDRIWTTSHCAKWVPAKAVKLKRGKSHEFSIGWPVARSAEGCATSKAALGKGTYVAKAVFDGEDARQVFLVTKAS